MAQTFTPCCLDGILRRRSAAVTRTPDGKYYLFESTRGNKAEIWAIRDQHSLLEFLHRSPNQPFQLTSGQLSSRSPVISPDGKRIFVIGQQRRGEAQRWDEKTQQWVQAMGGVSAEIVTPSPDGQWISVRLVPRGHFMEEPR